MPTIATRISQMEQRLSASGPGRIIAIKSSGVDYIAVAAFLASPEVEYDKRKDLVAHIRLFAAGIASGVELLHITPLKRGLRGG